MSPNGTAVCLTLLAIVCWLWMYRGLFTGSSLPSWDGIVWYGEFHYYVRSLAAGAFPYWDPYSIGGTYFYPNVSHMGLLDPTVPVWAALVRLAALTPLRAYSYFRLARLGLFGLGSYLFFRQATRSSGASLFGATALVIGLSPSYFRQPWVVDVAWLAPYSMAFLAAAFDPTSTGWRRAMSALGVALSTGVAANIYIPSFHLLNLICFAIVALATGLISRAEVARTLKCRGSWLVVAGTLAIVALLCAPQTALLARDLTIEGELFPVQRVMQHFGVNKQIVASEVDVSALSPGYYGAIASFLPLSSLAGFFYSDGTGSVEFYLGIAPLLFVLLGGIRARTPYRSIAILLAVIVLANMVTHHSVGRNQPFNWIQDLFNLVFPPLKILRVRELLVSYLGLYCSLLAALGMSVLVRDCRNGDRSGGRKATAALLVFLPAAKLSIGVFLGRHLFASPADVAILGSFAATGMLLWSGKCRTFVARWVAPFLALLAMADVLGVLAARPNGQLSEPDRVERIGDLARHGDGVFSRGPLFSWFREPIVGPPRFGFAAAVLGEKSSMYSGNDSLLFTTKRYYDLFTHVPVESQFALGAVATPIARFYPAQAAYQSPQPLQRLSEEPLDALSSRILLETAGAGRLAAEPTSLSEAPDAVWLGPENVKASYAAFRATNAVQFDSIRNNPRSVLDTPTSSVDVSSFSPNHVTFKVTNTEPGYLSYADGWSKYWEATDNGKPVPLLIANYNGKAVFLPPGDHEVTMTFNPRHFRWALWAYHGGLGLGGVWLAGLWVASRREVRPPGQGAENETVAG